MGQELAEITSRRICRYVVTHQKLRRDVISAASGQAEPLTLMKPCSSLRKFIRFIEPIHPTALA